MQSSTKKSKQSKGLSLVPHLLFELLDLVLEEGGLLLVLLALGLSPLGLPLFDRVALHLPFVHLPLELLVVALQLTHAGLQLGLACGEVQVG